MKEESKQILLEEAVIAVRKPGWRRGVLTSACLLCAWSWIVFPEWDSMLKLAFLFALLAIAYKPEKP